MIKVNIDGQDLEVREGTSVLEACRQAGAYIPTLCYDPDLHIDGSCRLCMVEIAGRNNLIPSCATPCEEGMQIITSSARLDEARRVILELLLARHPLHCSECSKSGQCQLEEYCQYYGVKESRFKGERISFNIEDTNPFIQRDYDECVMCTRCVRACAEITGANAIDIKGRGHLASIATAFNGMLKGSSCVYCGQCIMVCPVNALKSKKSLEADLIGSQKVLTTCAFCGVGCTLQLNVKDDMAVGVTSLRDQKYSPVNRGALCVKGRFGWDSIYDNNRLMSPLIRDEGKLKTCSWDTALDYTVDRIETLRDQYGPQSLAMFCSSRLTNEENYLAQKWMRAGIGSNNVNQCSKVYDLEAVTALRSAFGIGASSNTIEELEKETEVIFIIGSNTTVKHPVIGFKIKQSAIRRGAKLIVADPRKIELANVARVNLQFKAGSDIALINGIMHIIIKENWLNTEFIQQNTEGFASLRETVEKYTPEYVKKVTGVAESDLREAARLYSQTEKAALVFGNGLFEGERSRDKVRSVCNLVLLTGHIGKRGSGIYFLREQSNVQGSCDMGGLCNFYSDYQPVCDPEIRAKFAKVWKRELPDHKGIDLVTTIQKIRDRDIKGLIVFGANPVKRNPGLIDVGAALKKLDFLMVQDLELSETAQLAHVVLPGVSFAGKDGTYTSTERRVQKVRKAIPAMGKSRQEWDIICDLSIRMGYPMHYNSAEEIFEEMKQLTPSYAGMSYARLEGEGLFWPCPEENHPGTPILYKDGLLKNGKGRFQAIEY